jgi:anti-sigma factor RsiW
MKSKSVNKIRCSEVAKYVCENLDEQLNSRKCRAIKKHLHTCPKCAKHLDAIKKTVFLYRNCPTPVISAETHKKLMVGLSLMIMKK